MKAELQRRLEALEQRSQSKAVPEGLGHFYSVLSDEERAQAIASMYPGEVLHETELA